MSPLNENKYNHHSKSKEWFSIKQNRFDTTNHPIITSRRELKFRMKTILSQQEEQMLNGLTNTLQCDKREAIRIAFYEAARRGKDWVGCFLPFASRTSKHKAHVGRSRELTVALTKTEKNKILALGNELDLSEKEVFRIAIIWLQMEIRNGHLRNIKNCKLISQDKLAREWSRKNQGKPPSQKTAKLKAEINAYQELFDMELFPIEECLPTNSYANNFFSYPHIYGELKNVIKFEMLKNGKNIEDLNAKEKRLFGLMSLYDIDKDLAQSIADDDYEEYKEYQDMSKREVVDFHNKMYDKEVERNQKEKEIHEQAKALNQKKLEDGTHKPNVFYVNEQGEKTEFTIERVERIRDLVHEFFDWDRDKNPD